MRLCVLHIGHRDFGEPQITKRVYHKCITKIHDWIDVEGMLPQLMEHNVISGRDDMHRITHGSPRENLNYLYSKLCGCKNGFQLFYQCLRESQGDYLGHRDAADKLEETGLLYNMFYCRTNLNSLLPLCSSKYWTRPSTSVLSVTVSP